MVIDVNAFICKGFPMNMAYKDFMNLKKINDCMGNVLISLNAMVETPKKGIDSAISGKPGHKWGGELFVDDIDVAAKDSTYHVDNHEVGPAKSIIE
jgi:hypothetical protein